MSCALDQQTLIQLKTKRTFPSLPAKKKTHTHFFFHSRLLEKYIGTLIIQSIMSIIQLCFVISAMAFFFIGLAIAAELLL